MTSPFEHLRGVAAKRRADANTRRTADAATRAAEFQKMLEYVRSGRSEFGHLDRGRQQQVEADETVVYLGPGRGADAAQYEDTISDPTATAAAIIRAAAKARTPTKQVEPLSDTAKAILAAGRKRRGEP